MTALSPEHLDALQARLRNLVEACGRAVRFTRLNPTEVALVVTEARNTLARLSSECEDLRRRLDAAEPVAAAWFERWTLTAPGFKLTDEWSAQMADNHQRLLAATEAYGQPASPGSPEGTTPSGQPLHQPKGQES